MNTLTYYYDDEDKLKYPDRYKRYLNSYFFKSQKIKKDELMIDQKMKKLTLFSKKNSMKIYVDKNELDFKNVPIGRYQIIINKTITDKWIYILNDECITYNETIFIYPSKSYFMTKIWALNNDNFLVLDVIMDFIMNIITIEELVSNYGEEDDGIIVFKPNTKSKFTSTLEIIRLYLNNGHAVKYVDHWTANVFILSLFATLHIPTKLIFNLNKKNFIDKLNKYGHIKKQINDIYHTFIRFNNHVNNCLFNIQNPNEEYFYYDNDKFVIYNL